MKVSFTLSTEIIIEAPPSIVWSIITDTRNYAQWNPFIREMNPVNSDKIMVGKDIQLICYKAKRQEARLESSHTQSFKAKIIEFLPEQKLSWTGCILSPLIFEGEHMFALDPITNSNGGDKFTRFIHEENFKGLLLIILKRKLSVDTRSNFIKMNEALKRVSEDAKINNE